MAMTVQSSPSLTDADENTHAGTSAPNTPLAASDTSEDFCAVFERHMPSSRKPIKHESTSVLMLSYDSQDEANMNVKEEVQRLGDVLQDDYGFYVEQQVIECERNAQLQMHSYLSKFAMEHGKKHALLIIYYAGHGWHSSVRKHSHPGSFDLAPRAFKANEVPSGKGMIMWEGCEAVLHHVEGDVLVIFDCCDAGSLADLRSSGRAFEYLGACKERRYTWGPGKHSFTSALTWALKELRSEPSFTSEDLRSMITTHQHFPRDQSPVLFPRNGYMPENVWITKMRKVATPTFNRQRSISAPEYRDENCHFVDFRVIFSQHLADSDGQTVAKMMSPLVCDRNLPLNARHVSVVRKGVCKPSRSRELWNRASNRIIAAHRFLPNAGANKKRDRVLFESAVDDEANLRKRSKSSFTLEVENGDQLPITPLSEDPESGIGMMPKLRIVTALGPTPAMLEAQRQLELPSVSQTKNLLRDLERLKQSALEDPDLQRVFHLQIRAMLDGSEGTIGDE